MVQKFIHRGVVLLASVAVIGVAILPTAAYADTTIDGPVGLGTAETFAVLAGSTVTNALNPTTVVTGDLGISPGTSFTGGTVPFFIQTGTQHLADSVANQAKDDLTTAYNTAASLTPTRAGLAELSGLGPLTPGVYSGGELSLTGDLVLDGAAESVWVFQAASTLTVASDIAVTVTGGASVCNVFWQVGTSATIGSNADFVGTVMADQSITAVTGAEVDGRLLARTGAVTLDTNRVTRPTGCSATGGAVTTSPTITSAGPTAGTAGTPYSYTVTASGTPTPTYTITGGTLPTGLGLDATSGVISGTPTTPGTYTFTVTASNGTSADASATYTVVIAAPTVAAQTVAAEAVAAGEQLAESGSDLTLPIVLGGALLAAGAAFFFIARGARIARRR
ncbi:MAG: ice-binding family protein [Microbacterium sp.]|uniref:ice-binding family protein n=1 Tax=Microbacterium sp. TaxID=51671 RepID=UPI0027276199|nr:ice-binding family protein [Microbacterium sp.]MDO8384721.1 ice-binding family protein [Microbacterium sp.]